MALRVLLLLFVVLFAGFTRVSGVPEADDAAEFYVLILGATLGMCLMVVGQSRADDFAGDRDGQRAVAMCWRASCAAAAEQRGGA